MKTLLSKLSVCICRGWSLLKPVDNCKYIFRDAYLHLIEHGVGLHVGRVLRAAQDEAPDGRLHEQLLEDGVHVAGRAAVADAHIAAGIAAQPGWGNAKLQAQDSRLCHARHCQMYPTMNGEGWCRSQMGLPGTVTVMGLSRRTSCLQDGTSRSPGRGHGLVVEQACQIGVGKVRLLQQPRALTQAAAVVRHQVQQQVQRGLRDLGFEVFRSSSRCNAAWQEFAATSHSHKG